MSDSSDLDWMIRANAPAKGKRPDFFGDPDKEKLLSMLLALVAEHSVLRERLDTVERLLEQRGALDRSAIEAYAPEAQAAAERGAMIREYIARIMRGPQQAMEAMTQDEKPVEEISRELRES
jgi:predicted  nucleic acid-binding Zn-ribbon protein